ncbi:hypothetical protein Salat_2558100 [Sesamum alatum]|uniref:Uncharacterized protein n=1 Tax=Sesamum alatum TaxID=300844 RepID=A0AAE1XSU8_9LAMI|nr:hypothetical protein Salat_2558100 [Sesamum alatum]
MLPPFHCCRKLNILPTVPSVKALQELLGDLLSGFPCTSSDYLTPLILHAPFLQIRKLGTPIDFCHFILLHFKLSVTIRTRFSYTYTLASSLERLVPRINDKSIGLTRSNSAQRSCHPLRIVQFRGARIIGSQLDFGTTRTVDFKAQVHHFSP